MGKLSIVFILSFLLVNCACSQHRLDSLLSMVYSIESIDDHNNFLAILREKDQKFRGDKADINNDRDNIVLASTYVNLHGFPSLTKLPAADILSYVWVHSSLPEAMELAFPIIKKGVKSGAIDKSMYRKYYLSGLYRMVCDDGKFNSLSNEEIISKLGANVNDKIDVRAITDAYDMYFELISKFEVVAQVWKTEEEKEYYEIGGVKHERTVDPEFLEIRKWDNDSYFRRYSKHWKEDKYRRITYVDANQTFKSCSDQLNYYGFVGGEIRYYSSSGKVLKTYIRVR